MADGDWIVEAAADGTRGRLAHAAEPWFACSFAESAEAAGEFYGLTVEADGGFFHSFVWRDGIPHESVLRGLCAGAMRALSRRRHGGDAE